MILRQLTVGPLDVNCYIIGDDITKEAICIDPGGNVDDIIEIIEEDGLNLKYIINTHGHFDHIGGNTLLKQATSASLAIHKDDISLLKDAVGQAAFFGITSKSSPEPDIILKHGGVVKFGRMEAKIIHTPGHTKGGICILIDNALFTGDTLFADSIGRTDLPDGSFKDLISSIKDRLMNLDDNIMVYPGHGPSSTIKEERKNNTFLKGG